MNGEAIELLQKLIRNKCVGTDNPDSGNEMRSVNTLIEYFESYDIKNYEIFKTNNERGNLLIKIKGSDPNAHSLIYESHLDVVPVNAAEWEVDPFEGKIIDEYLWGRGTIDMLYYTATQAVAFANLHKNGFKPKGDLLFLAVSDEESGAKYGARWLIENVKDKLLSNDTYLIGEFGGAAFNTPKGVKIGLMNAEKGPAWFDVKIKGAPGHASMTYKEDNAIFKLSKILTLIQYDYSYAIVSLYNSNGTMNSMNDIDPNGNMSIIEITNSLMDIVNSDIANVKVNTAGDLYNPSFINTFNDTLIRGDLFWNTLSVMRHNNLVINGNLKQTVVVNHPDASWEEYGFGVNFVGVIKTTISNENLFAMKYNFRILDGSKITITGSSIDGLSSVNSTVIIFDSEILTAEFGFNSTVKIYNNLIENTFHDEGMKFSHNSSFYFYNTYFGTNTFGGSLGSYTNLYFENSFFNSTLYAYAHNITAVNTYFYQIFQFDSAPGVFSYNFTDSIIDVLQIHTLNNDKIYYWYFANTSIQFFNGGNYDYISTLHISMKDSEVLWVYEWDWGQVPDLTTINTILNRHNEMLTINYYEDYVQLIWTFPTSIYNSAEIGQRTIERRDNSGGEWSNWGNLETITGSSYIDTTIMEGVFYAYRVLNHYDTDFMIYQKSYEDTYNLFPAKLAYDLDVTLHENRIYNDPSQATIQDHFQCRVIMPGTDQTVSFDETTIQYQFF